MSPNDKHDYYVQQVQKAQEVQQMMDSPGWQHLLKECVNANYIYALNSLVDVEEVKREVPNDVLRGQLQAYSKIFSYVSNVIQTGESATSYLANNPKVQ